MAAPNKKRATDEQMKLLEEKEEGDSGNELAEESDMDDGSDDSDMVDEEIQVDFEARSPEDCDFDGIRKLIHQCYLKANVNISELADTIISQNYVGSIIKQGEVAMDDDDSEEEDDGDVFGVLSVINITERKELDCVKQIKSLILDKCKECSSKQTDGWSKLLHGGQEVGLIVSERFINIPPQIALPSYESLQKEMTKATQKQMKYSFHYYVMVSKTYKFPPSAAVKSKQLSDQLAFANAEEEFLYDEAEMKFDFSVAAQRDTVVGGMWDDDDGEMIPYRTVMAIPASKMDTVMTKMRENLSMPT